MVIALRSLTPTADQTPAVVEASDKELSVAVWVSRFPTSTSIDDLASPFREGTAAFVAALRAGCERFHRRHAPASGAGLPHALVVEHRQ